MATKVVDKVYQHFSQYPKRAYPKGQILVFADENPEHVYYIVHGRVAKYDVSYQGDEVIVNIFKDGAFFPMSWAINRSPNQFFYKTEVETELHVIPADDALAFLKDNPDVMLDLLSRIYRGMDGLMGRMVHLMSGTAKSRLMYELVIESRRFGTALPGGAIKLAATEADLAARSGLTRETVSREMRKLKDQGWVTVGNKGIVIEDCAAIQQAIGAAL